MIELKDIKKTFSQGFIPKPVEILKGLTFTVEKGAVYGYLGPNGAGKTTTIKILMNLIMPDSGSIHATLTVPDWACAAPVPKAVASASEIAAVRIPMSVVSCESLRPAGVVRAGGRPMMPANQAVGNR